MPRQHRHQSLASYTRHCLSAIAAVLFGLSAYAGLLAPAWAQIVEMPIPGDPVMLDSGAVAGKILASGVRAYLGIPYAAAPVRELRWREPQPVVPWKGVYNADRKAPECIQILRAHNINHYFGEEATSEDCLYLNVWAPGAGGSNAKRPVLVWIFGGGFTIGSSGMANYSGENLAKKDVVFVNFNYRVGALGFLAHPELTAESAHRSSGNYGLLDQVALLQWIQRNVAKFGGDPDNVTILGQSAGAASVSYLQASPLGRGLFHRVVAMSGSAVGSRALPDLKAAEQDGLQYQQALKAASINEMRQIAADKILSIQADCQFGCSGSVRVGPDVDGYFLPESPNQIFAAGRQNDVPLMLGFTHDESTNALRSAKTVAEYEGAARKLYGNGAAEFLKRYPVASDSEISEVAGTAAREAGIEASMRAWAQAQARTGKAPVHLFMFSRVQPYVEGVRIAEHDTKTVGAYHTGDVPYWFQNLDVYNMFRPTREWAALDRDLSNKMSNALVAFAKTGDPATSGIQWPRYETANEQLIEFGDSVRVLPMNTARLDFVSGLTPIPAPPAPARPRD